MKKGLLSFKIVVLTSSIFQKKKGGPVHKALANAGSGEGKMYAAFLLFPKRQALPLLQGTPSSCRSFE